MDTKTILDKLEDAFTEANDMTANTLDELRANYWIGRSEGIRQVINIINLIEKKEE